MKMARTMTIDEYLAYDIAKFIREEAARDGIEIVADKRPKLATSDGEVVELKGKDRG